MGYRQGMVNSYRGRISNHVGSSIDSGLKEPEDLRRKERVAGLSV